MLKTVKRVMSDLKENAEQPIDGVKLYLVNRKDDKDADQSKELFSIHCEIDIKYGPYEGVIVHTILHIPVNYPYTAPAMNIAPDYEFTHDFHEHVFGKSICNDMLSNFAWFFELSSGSQEKVASGWSSGYTLNVILGQMQVFFADPDLREMPSEQAIEKLKAFSRAYKCPDCSQKRTYRDLVADSSDSNKVEKSKEEKELDELKKQLVCGITKQDIASTPDIVIGYPLLMSVDKYNRLWPQIVLETISYEAYAQKIQMSGIEKLDNFTAISMYSAKGERFNYWIPIYVNETHFKRALVYIQNAISVIRYGVKGTRANDFRPDMILEVLPCLMNKNIVHIMNGTVFHSTAAIQAYCSFLRLYLRLIQMYNLKPKLNERVLRFMKNDSERNKKQCGDLGEFIINMFLSDHSYLTNEALKKALVGELFARQIFWIEKNESMTLERLGSMDERLRRAFNGSKTSNHLFVFNIEMAKLLIIGHENKIKILDERFGFLPEHVINSFQKRIVEIKNINNYGTLMNAIGYSSIIKSPQAMSEFLLISKKLAQVQKYIN